MKKVTNLTFKDLIKNNKPEDILLFEKEHSGFARKLFSFSLKTKENGKDTFLYKTKVIEDYGDYEYYELFPILLDTTIYEEDGVMTLSGELDLEIYVKSRI